MAGNLAIERLLVTRRGRKDLRWAAKEAAVAIGCHSITFSVAPGFPRTMRRQASGWNSRANRLHDLESVQHVREHRRQACEVEEGALARCVLVERSARNPRSPRTKDGSLKRLSESAGRTFVSWEPAAAGVVSSRAVHQQGGAPHALACLPSTPVVLHGDG